VLERAAPVELDAVPALQLTQPVDPCAAWYMPDAQSVQPEAPAAEKVPAPHAKQADAPVDGW
jgi:hypothetical protein